MSFDSNHNLEKGPFVYKFVFATQLLKYLTLWFAWLSTVITSTVTCKCLILATRQRTMYDLSPSW